MDTLLVLFQCLGLDKADLGSVGAETYRIWGAFLKENTCKVIIIKLGMEENVNLERKRVTHFLLVNLKTGH